MTQADFYPVDWHALAFDIKEANEWTCQMCDKPCRTPGAVFDTYRLELTVAHIDQDYEGDAIQVAALCVPCHLRYDAPFGWQAHLRHKRFRQRQAGQLKFLFAGGAA